jgi:hypothetical protein
MAEHQVMSCYYSHNSYSHDFVSHPNATLTAACPSRGVLDQQQPQAGRRASGAIC